MQGLLRLKIACDRYKALSEDEKQKIKKHDKIQCRICLKKRNKGIWKTCLKKTIKKRRNAWKNTKNIYIEKIKQNHVWKSIQADAVTNFIKNKVDGSSDI